MVGGALGALLRWGLELVLPVADGWPWATLLTNVLGSAALGWLVVHGDRHRHPRWVRPGVGTGLLGGFTTFSTYAVQVALLGRVDPLVALGYLLVTAGLCVTAVGIGARVARGARS